MSYATMVGDLPLVDPDFWGRYRGEDHGFPDWAVSSFADWDGETVYLLQRNKRYAMEQLQRSLHDESTRNDAKVAVVGGYHLHFNRKRGTRDEWWRAGGKFNREKVPFHTKILGNWQVFSGKLQDKNDLQQFQILDVMLPPDFFQENIAPIIKNNVSTLSYLELNSCDLKSDDVDCIAKFIKKSPLSTLDLANNDILDTVDSAKQLSKAIKGHKKLAFLNLSGCNLGQNIDCLKVVLSSSKKLTGLLLADNGIKSEEGVALLSDFVNSNMSTTVFDVAGNEMGDSNVNALKEALDDNTNLEQLSIGRNNLSVSAIIDGRNGLKMLTHVDLSKNSINKVSSVKAIGKFLARNPSLVELNLSGNSISSKCIGELASALKKNTHLQHLDLTSNKLTGKCVPALTDALLNNSTLLSLNLCNNNISVKDRVELTKAVFDTTSLQAVALSNHTCKLIFTENNFKNSDTREMELKALNSLGDKAKVAHLKVVFAMFTTNKELFDLSSFSSVPLELIPRLLQLVQHEIGYKGFGTEIVKSQYRRASQDPTLGRVYETLQGPSLPSLFERGPGTLKKKSVAAAISVKKRKRYEEDDDYVPGYGGKASSGELKSSSGRSSKEISYADADSSDDSDGEE